MGVVLKSKGSTRFDARLSIEQKELFERAAVLSGYKSLSEFIIRTVHQKAKQVIKDNDLILASNRDSEIFFDSLLKPKAPNTALKSAAKKYKASQK